MFAPSTFAPPMSPAFHGYGIAFGGLGSPYGLAVPQALAFIAPGGGSILVAASKIKPKDPDKLIQWYREHAKAEYAAAKRAYALRLHGQVKAHSQRANEYAHAAEALTAKLAAQRMTSHKRPTTSVYRPAFTQPLYSAKPGQLVPGMSSGVSAASVPRYARVSAPEMQPPVAPAPEAVAVPAPAAEVPLWQRPGVWIVAGLVAGGVWYARRSKKGKGTHAGKSGSALDMGSMGAAA